MIGLTAGGYQISHLLAEGGMGSVWSATHPVLGRDAVVKLLLPELSHNAEMVRRFFNEARAAASINDPGIVQIFDVGNLPDGRAYIVMERLDGETLAARLRTACRLPIDKTVHVLRLIARTLGAAHAEGIVHRDLKPENIFLVPDLDVAGGERTKILDFGIAKLTDTGGQAQLTRAGSVFGTPAYMAPEQCADAATVDARADLYAIGCIAYEMLAGTPPFGSGGIEIIASHLRDEPEPLHRRGIAVPPALDDVIAKLLRKDPAERYQSSNELFTALEGLATLPPPTSLVRPAIVPVSSQAVTAMTIDGAQVAAPAPPRSRTRGYLVAVILALVAAAVTTTVIATRGHDDPAPTISSRPPPPPPPAPPIVDQGNALADAIQARSDERWADAITAAQRVTRDNELERARVILETARTESLHQQTFEGVVRAVARKDVAAATLAMASIPETSLYRARAQATITAAEAEARNVPKPKRDPRKPEPRITEPRITEPKPVEPKPVEPDVKPHVEPVPPEIKPHVEPVVPDVKPHVEPVPPEIKPPAPLVAPPPEVTPPKPRRPTVRAIEVGPIWNNADAQRKCATACKPPATWNKGWRTTVPNKQSVCDCVTP